MSSQSDDLRAIVEEMRGRTVFGPGEIWGALKRWADRLSLIADKGECSDDGGQCHLCGHHAEGVFACQSCWEDVCSHPAPPAERTIPALQPEVWIARQCYGDMKFHVGATREAAMKPAGTPFNLFGPFPVHGATQDKGEHTPSRLAGELADEMEACLVHWEAMYSKASSVVTAVRDWASRVRQLGEGECETCGTGEPGETIVESLCPCCGARLDIMHGSDEVGQISIVGTPTDHLAACCTCGKEAIHHMCSDCLWDERQAAYRRGAAGAPSVLSDDGCDSRPDVPAEVWVACVPNDYRYATLEYGDTKEEARQNLINEFDGEEPDTIQYLQIPLHGAPKQDPDCKSCERRMEYEDLHTKLSQGRIKVRVANARIEELENVQDTDTLRLVEAKQEIDAALEECHDALEKKQGEADRLRERIEEMDSSRMQWMEFAQTAEEERDKAQAEVERLRKGIRAVQSLCNTAPGGMLKAIVMSQVFKGLLDTPENDSGKGDEGCRELGKEENPK